MNIQNARKCDSVNISRILNSNGEHVSSRNANMGQRS